jgi:hypothetical protein
MRSEALTRFSTPPYSLRVPLLPHHTAPQPPLQKGPPKEALSKKKKRKKEKERKEAVATKHTQKKRKESKIPNHQNSSQTAVAATTSAAPHKLLRNTYLPISKYTQGNKSRKSRRELIARPNNNNT